MNTRTIQKLRYKFILVSTLTYFLVMIFIGVCINLSNYVLTHNQIRKVLDYILENEGIIETGLLEKGAEGSPVLIADSPSKTDTESSLSSSAGKGKIQSLTRPDAKGSVLDEFSPNFRYSAHYFTATFSEEGELIDLRTTNINEFSEKEAGMLAREAYSQNRRYGRFGYYYYERGELPSGENMVVFLSCVSQLRASERIVTITFMICLAGMLITLVLVCIFSNRMIKPEIENVRRQKQFITNASHELKTPLAVIRANTEIEEMMNGESEWTQSTMRQVDRLDGLVQNLVMISRAAEREDRSVMTEIDVSKNVEESVNPYRSLAQQDKKELVLEITPGIRMVADESKIRQLTTLLVDNAFKYCDDEGKIRVSLDPLRKGKSVRLVVANTFAEGANVDYSRFFERFYREDESHNVDKGGYGIGLSIAESICHQYGGTISVGWKNGEIAFTCILN